LRFEAHEGFDMAFCANCGAGLTGPYCEGCGTPAQTLAGDETTLPEHVSATLCYLAGFLTGLLFLTLEPYSNSRVIRFHAWQSILLSVSWIFAWLVLAFAAWVLPVFIASFLAAALLFGCAILWGVLMYKVFQRDSVVVPFIGDWAQRNAARPSTSNV
jgi:uncharacterized membrane protein